MLNNTTQPAAPATRTITYEREECTRCGGTGQYPSACYNGLCLGCSGTGRKLTRRGKAAKAKIDALLNSLCAVRVDALAPGMRVRTTDASGKTRSSVRRGAIIKAVRATGTAAWNGEPAYEVSFNGITCAGLPASNVWALIPTPEQFAQAEALAAKLAGCEVVVS